MQYGASLGQRRPEGAVAVRTLNCPRHAGVRGLMRLFQLWTQGP